MDRKREQREDVSGTGGIVVLDRFKCIVAYCYLHGTEKCGSNSIVSHSK